MSDDRPLRVLCDVCHPAHVHLFRHTIKELDERGHETLVTSRKKEVTTDLLDAYGIEHQPLSAKGTSKLALISEWTWREYRLLQVARRFDPDVILSHINPAAAHVGTLTGAPSIVFNDDEAATRVIGRLTTPFASMVCTPQAFSIDLGSKHRRYEGYHELAYLHPNRFDPDPDLLREYGVEPTEPYYVLRFVSWGAHHDIGENGLSRAAKRDMIEFLDDHGDVYVSTESDLPAEFAAHEFPVPPEHVHHLLYYANLYAGDSQTMALEAGMLGTPSVRSNSFAASETMGHFAELENEYRLVRSVGDETQALTTIKDIVAGAGPDGQDRWQKRRERLLEDKIDVTTFILKCVFEEAGREYPSDDRKSVVTQV